MIAGICENCDAYSLVDKLSLKLELCPSSPYVMQSGPEIPTISAGNLLINYNILGECQEPHTLASKMLIHILLLWKGERVGDHK